LNTSPLPAILLAYSNSDFTNPHEVLWSEAPADCRTHFTHMGAKYTGFESDRHRATSYADQGFHYDHDAHHWIEIGLKQRCVIERLSISTRWFTGNQVRAVSVYLIDDLTGARHQVLDRQPLEPDTDHEFPISSLAASECRVECFYEGGIARIHLWGHPAEEDLPERTNLLEGATISHISNDHYGNPAMAVAGNRNEHHMVGWESARTGFGERALFHLPSPAVIQEIVVDTYLHRLNAPLSCHIFGLHEEDPQQVESHMQKAPRWKLVLPSGDEIIPENFKEYMLGQKYLEQGLRQFQIQLHLPSSSWLPILPGARLFPDRYHRFRKLECPLAITHLLYMHYPNGGIHGLKAF
jgi:allantoicase